MQGKGSRGIRTRRDLYYFFFTILLILPILYLWDDYLGQRTKIHFHDFRQNTDVGQTHSAIKAPAQQNGGTRKLSFIVAGVQKAGTTALNDYLRQHPHLSLPKKKESEFFDHETLNWTTPDYTAYEFRNHSKTKSAIAGECSPNYIYWPDSMERIKSYNPDMKLIFLFRQPVQRAWSQWKMSCRKYYEDAPFSWAIREGRARVVTNPKMPGYHRAFSYVERGFYGEQLQRVLQLFPREQLLLLLSDDLRADPTRIMRQISRFLRIPELEGEVKQLRSNVSPQLNNETALDDVDATYLQNLYNEDLKYFEELSGLDIAAWFP